MGTNPPASGTVSVGVGVAVVVSPGVGVELGDGVDVSPGGVGVAVPVGVGVMVPVGVGVEEGVGVGEGVGLGVKEGVGLGVKEGVGLGVKIAAVLTSLISCRCLIKKKPTPTERQMRKIPKPAPRFFKLSFFVWDDLSSSEPGMMAIVFSSGAGGAVFLIFIF